CRSSPASCRAVDSPKPRSRSCADSSTTSRSRRLASGATPSRRRRARPGRTAVPRARRRKTMWSWILENTLVSSALAVVVAISCRSLRARPAVCHFLWLLVLVRLVCPPLHVSAWPPEGVRRFATALGADVAAWVSPRVEPTKSEPATRADDDDDRLAEAA